jgi:hypothetical protein
VANASPTQRDAQADKLTNYLQTFFGKIRNQAGSALFDSEIEAGKIPRALRDQFGHLSRRDKEVILDRLPHLLQEERIFDVARTLLRVMPNGTREEAMDFLRSPDNENPYWEIPEDRFAEIVDLFVEERAMLNLNQQTQQADGLSRRGRAPSS